jgi:hypothetical protein
MHREAEGAVIEIGGQRELRGIGKQVLHRTCCANGVIAAALQVGGGRATHERAVQVINLLRPVRAAAFVIAHFFGLGIGQTEAFGTFMRVARIGEAIPKDNKLAERRGGGVCRDREHGEARDECELHVASAVRCSVEYAAEHQIDRGGTTCRWMPRVDSNHDWRSQNPLSYH